MDQARLFMAIALSFLIFFLWNSLFVKKEPAKQENQPSQADRLEPQTPYLKQKETLPTETFEPSTTQPTVVKNQKAAIFITVDTPLYRVKISERGGVFKSYVLKNFRERVEKDAPLKELVAEGLPSGTLQLGFAGNSVPGISDAIYSTTLTSNTVDATHYRQTVSFRWRSPEGIVVEKTFLFSPETYLIRLVVTIKLCR